MTKSTKPATQLFVAPHRQQFYRYLARRAERNNDIAKMQDIRGHKKIAFLIH